MRSRLVRLALVAVGVLGLTAMPVEPAGADTVGSAAFVANATVTGGIGYPVLTLTPTPNDLLPTDGWSPLDTTAHALDATLSCLPLPPNSVLGDVEELTGEPWNCHWVFDHHRGVTVGSIACAGAAANNDKPGLPAASGPACTFEGGGFVTGHCGLSGGQVTVEFTDGHNVYILRLHFRGVGGVLVLTGHWTNDLGQHGKVYAEAAAVPLPSVGGQSCTNKTQEDFLVSGVAELYTDPNL